MNPPPSPVTSHPVPQPPIVRPTLYLAIGVRGDGKTWKLYRDSLQDFDTARTDAGFLRHDMKLKNVSIITIPGEVEEARDRKRWKAALEVIRLARDLTTGIGQGSRLDTACKAFDALEGA